MTYRTNTERINALKELLKVDGNKECADCGAKGPQWASWTLGVFLCINCAGIHRSMGTHISKVRSVSLDTWTDEQVANMKNIGNTRARSYYEANVPDHYSSPREGSSGHSLENWIRAKYEKKQFISRGGNPKGSAPTQEYHGAGGARGNHVNDRSSPNNNNGVRRLGNQDNDHRGSSARNRSEPNGNHRQQNQQQNEGNYDPFGDSANTNGSGISLLEFESSSNNTTTKNNDHNSVNPNLFSDAAFQGSNGAQPNNTVNAPAQPSKDSIMSLYQQPFGVSQQQQQQQLQQQQQANFNAGAYQMQYGVYPGAQAAGAGQYGVIGYPNMTPQQIQQFQLQQLQLLQQQQQLQQMQLLQQQQHQQQQQRQMSGATLQMYPAGGGAVGGVQYGNGGMQGVGTGGSGFNLYR